MEASNAAAMRKALEYVIQWREDCIDEEGADNVDDMMAVVNAALSAPARNCDMGSEEEQSRRYEAFCEVHHMQCDKGCSACPCSKKSGVSCELYWAQMPYVEKEGEDNDK